MVHDVTKYDLLVTPSIDGLPIPEGPFKPKTNGGGT